MIVVYLVNFCFFYTSLIKLLLITGKGEYRSSAGVCMVSTLWYDVRTSEKITIW